MFVAALVTLLVTFEVGTLLGWLATKDGPLNWRILLGPIVYYNWLDGGK